MAAEAPPTPQQPVKSEISTVLYGQQTVTNTILEFITKTNEGCDTFIDKTGPSIFVGVEPIRKAIADAKNNKGLKLRAITEITKDNIQYCKEYMQIITELRHLDGLKGNFGVSESEYIATPISQEEQALTQLIYSNIKNIVEQHKYLFENLWGKAISAEQKIREIEEGVVLGSTEVILIPSRIKELFVDLVKSAKEEVLMVLPTTNAFLREERIGVIQLLKEAAKYDVNVRLMTPTNESIEKIIKNIMIEVSSTEQLQKQARNFTIRCINPTHKSAVSTVTILVADRKISLVIEKKDDSKENFIDAVGMATYSTSKPTVSSYISIFENLWTQTELYEQLKIHETMQKEFINIAAHEMRTPVQSILGYSELLQQNPENSDELTGAIYRNAVRLNGLTNDILDVTRIESRSLRLNKERFSLNDLISTVIADSRNFIKKENYAVNLFYESKKDFIVRADKGRITQVIYNVINNAIKFTNKLRGEIHVKIFLNPTGDQVIVSVKDNGTGIDREIMPRLFTKFATKSFTGTGLGLFISKGIIEAHGGKMWAENNTDDKKGAMFYFSLPLPN